MTELLDLRPLDELTLTACPIVIGSGQRPFDKTTTRMPFPVRETTTLNNGYR